MLKTLGMHDTFSQRTILVLCDKGKTGTLRQCEAIAYPLADHFNAHVTLIDVDLPFWYKFFTPFLSRHWPLKFTPKHNLLSEKPFLIIAAGRQAFVLAAPLAKHIPTIALLNPRCSHDYFKIIIPPQHDGVGSYPNVIETLGALHPHKAASFEATEKNQNTHTLTVLLGGDSKHYRFQNADFSELATYLKQKMSLIPNAQLLITASRRTPPHGIHILQTELAGLNVTFWNGDGINPYFNYLGSADEILVTGDSISMISEACYMGKPVEIWPLPVKNKRFHRFYNEIIKNQHAVFANTSWPAKFAPLRERDRVLPLVINLLERI
ncbi:MAG: ELM1/GtrOC1 family putative glycosyltransferase [Pseudomonadota bacterium]